MNSFRSIEVRLHFGILVAFIAFAAACSPSNTSATSPTVGSAATANSGAGASTPAAPASASVSMTDALRFEPAALTVRRGATVTWRNTSATMHTVTDDPGKAANKADAALPEGAQPWDSGNINPGQTFQHTFDTPGTYKYFCTPHEAAGMLGTINVTG